MWNKSIGTIIILLKIACVSIRADDKAADSRTYNVDWMVKKEFKLIFDEASWYTANKFCMDNGMQLASIDTQEEHQHIENLIKDKYMVDEPFWVSKSITAVERTSGLAQSKPNFSVLDSINRCVSWYWTNAELCCALWPLANEWNHEDCETEKYFICQQTSKMEKEILEMIEKELLLLLDEEMFTEFADALPTTTESTWISFVEGAMQMWLVEQHQISKSISLFDEQVDLIAAEFSQNEKPFDTDELRRFVSVKYDAIDNEQRIELLSERFRKFIGDSYVDLAGSNWNKSPSDDDVAALIKKVVLLAKAQEIKLASEELAKMSITAPTDVLDEALMKSISQQLLTFSKNEFESYVMDVFTQLEVFGVEELDMDTLLQLYLLVKQELFSLIAKTVLKATSQERVEITNYVLSRILEGKQLIDDESVFGQIFVVIATGTAVLVEQKSVNGLDDKLLRKFVKQEFDGLRPEDLLKLKYEGYVKIVIDELIKLVADINLAKNDSGELVLRYVVDLIATQFLLYAEDELKIQADRLTQSFDEESTKLQTMFDETKTGLPMYDEDKLLRLIALIEQQLFTIVVNTLANFTEKEMLDLAAEGLSKILEESKRSGTSSITGRAFISLGEELSKITKDVFDAMKDEELMKMVKIELEKENYTQNIQLFEEVYMHLIEDEFVKLIERDAVMLSAHEEEKQQFGEMAKLLAERLLQIANESTDLT